jgi:uncharacterized membrane protein
MKKRFQSGWSLSLSTQLGIAWVIVIALILFYAVWMCDQSILRYVTFKATAFDLGNMDQATWNTLHGRPFQFTNQGSNWYGPPIRLAQHVEPIFFLLSLLYVFHADPRILLVFQSLLLALGALPVFLLTRKAIPTLPLLAPVISAGYLFAPALIGENMYDFHPVALATPFFLFAILFLTYRCYVWFVVFCILAASTKEEMPFVVGLMGLLVAWKYRLPRLGIALFICGAIWSAVAFLVIIPHFDVGATQNTFWYRYASLGKTPQQALVNVLLHPWLLAPYIFTLDRLYYLFSLVRSTGFLALLAPEWLLPTLPSLAINLLTDQPYQHSGVYQYNAAIISFVVIAAIQGLRRLCWLWYGWRGEYKEQELYREAVALNNHRFSAGKPLPGMAIARFRLVRIFAWIASGWRALSAFPVRRALLAGWGRLRTRARLAGRRLAALAQMIPVGWLQWLVSVFLVGMIILNYMIMMPWLNIFWADAQPDARDQHIQQLLNMIPADASVSAGGNLNPHLTERRYITVFPQLTVKAYGDKSAQTVEYVIVDLDDVSPEDKTQSAHFLAVLNQIEYSGQFVPVAQAEGVLLLKRAKP